MKRIIFTLLLCNLLSFSFSQSTETITLQEEYNDENRMLIEFHLPAFEIIDTNFIEEYEIDEIFNYIRIYDEFGIIDSVGLPQLPQLTFDLHIPYDAVDITVEIVSDTRHEMTVLRKIMPTQEDISNEEPIFNFQINDEYYNSSGGFCNLFVQLTEDFIVFGEHGISLTVFPFVYNPQENSLTVLTNAVFVVSYTRTGEVSETYSSEAKENYLSNIFKNYHKSGGNPIIGRYLMITPPEYENTLTYFANYKRNIGFDVEVVTVTAGSSVATVKNIIQNRYNNTSTRPDYVLLVGEVNEIPAYEGNEDMTDLDNPITDLGYSLLEGNDNLADVFLGRFSVSEENGNEELKNMINKTIFMEMNMHRFAKKAKFMAGTDASSSYMENQFKKGHDYVIPYSFKPLGYDCQKLYQSSINADAAALSDNPLFYLYSGHASAAGFNGVDSTKITNATNTVFPCVFVFACKAGNFAYTTDTTDACIGEHYIRAKDRGGVAYFGSSVTTYNNPDETLEKKIFGDAFLKDEQNLAVIINLGKRRFSYTSVTNKKIKRYIKAYNLLGDPSFDTKGIGCKESFTFYYPEVFESGAEVTYRANDFIENNNSFVVESGADVKLLAGNSVRLKPGFHAKAGSNVSIQIIPCNDGIIRKSMAGNDNDEIDDATEEIVEQKKDEIINPALFSVFPNPTSDEFSLAYTLDSSSFVQIDLYDMQGGFIKNFLKLPQQEAGTYYHNFSLSGLPIGMYLLVFKTASKTITNKIIKH